IATLMYAFEHRAQLSGRWGWMLASGIVDLILAGIIFAGLPETATWALGLLVGINLLFGGTALIGMALAARSAVYASGNGLDCDASPGLRLDLHLSPGRAGGDDTIDDLGCIGQRVAGEVSVTLRGTGVGVSPQRLHDIERDALVNEETGER